MSDGIITLTTDFGEASPYVAAMKGVILGINPAVRIVDLSHRVPPQNLGHAAYFLRTALPYFPGEAIHVVVVDPGVGTERALLYVETGGLRLLVPDNGCWTPLAGDMTDTPRVIRLTAARFWRHPVSATFHGRDVLAPVAGHLSRGVEPRELGPPVSDWVVLEARRPVIEPGRLAGEVVFVDDFGNLLTNLPGDQLLAWSDRPVRIKVGDHEVPRRVRTYGEAPPGTLVALISSAGSVEVAVSQGNAAARLGAGVGTPVTMELLS
jgi:S-adenosylmethionine hydrolase